jgi:lipoprotein-releasing system ATP-binding protein
MNKQMSIAAHNLSMRYDDAGRSLEIFSGLSFEAREGESVAIVGVSGVGKSTLLHILGGIEAPTNGDVIIQGTSVNELRSQGKDLASFRGRNIGFVFQFHHLLPEFDALENVAMPLFIQGIAKEKALERAEYLLRKMGLGERLLHRPGMLSGGEQQRVAIARAFSASPKIVLADEPTGNLDLATAFEIFEVLEGLRKEEKTTLIFVTHSKELANKMDRTLELSRSGLVPYHE